MKAIIKNANIRGREIKTNKKGEQYILVRYEEDETGAQGEIVDKEITRADFYKRDTIGDIYINIDQGKQFTTIRVIDFKVAQ